MNGTDERELERIHRRAFARFVALILSPAPRTLRSAATRSSGARRRKGCDEIKKSLT
jgi:hypothetical protein